MCVHPEAFARVKNFSPSSDNHCHDVYEEPTNLPSKAQWVARESSYHRPTKLNEIGEAETINE